MNDPALLSPEDRFSTYLTHSEPYVAAIAAAGGTPWHDGDTERRRALFFRRYHRPAPPEGLFHNLEDIRR